MHGIDTWPPCFHIGIVVFQKIQLFTKSEWQGLKWRTKKIFLSAGLKAVGKYGCLQMGERSQKSTVSIEKLCGSKAEVRVHLHGS